MKFDLILTLYTPSFGLDHCKLMVKSMFKHIYECRLRKSKKSQTAREATASDSKVIKRRCSSIRDPYLCNVRIKVSCFVDNTAVIVERIDQHIHTHDIEESFRIKKPSILTGFIKSEVVKNYTPAQIFHYIWRLELYTRVVHWSYTFGVVVYWSCILELYAGVMHWSCILELFTGVAYWSCCTLELLLLYAGVVH